jgi:deferrochelatase/peroxidase EfeB
MTSLDTDKVVAAASALNSLLMGLPQSERRDKALYHLDRLQRAVAAWHQEAVRFAAFTVNKSVHDSPEWGPQVAEAMEALRVSLAQSGHDFLKGN